MFKKVILSLIIVAGISLSSSACWFTSSNFNRGYLARINTKDIFSGTWGAITVTPAGTQDLPCQVWVVLAPMSESPTQLIVQTLLQYKKLPSGNWVSFKILNNTMWSVNYLSPMEIFGADIFDPPSAVAGDEYLVRLYFTDGIYENAPLATNAPEGGNTTWRNQWVTKITIGTYRRPGL